VDSQDYSAVASLSLREAVWQPQCEHSGRVGRGYVSYPLFVGVLVICALQVMCGMFYAGGCWVVLYRGWLLQVLAMMYVALYCFAPMLLFCCVAVVIAVVVVVVVVVAEAA
jgi:hypothetical protein